MELYIAIQSEFIQGDHVGDTILGVYDSADKAEERNTEVEMSIPFDPVLRTTFDIQPVKLNAAIEPE